MPFNIPKLMGILNVTPDSFSDGGDFCDPKTAVSHALRMIEEGADIIDIGGESSRPGSEPVSAEEELARVIPVIKSICHCESATGGRSNLPSSIVFGGSPRPFGARDDKPLISIDTIKSLVASEAIAAGANMINDISAGTFDPEMFAVAAKAGVPICLMHMKGRPKTMQAGEIRYDDVMGEIEAYLRERVVAAMAAGIRRANIIIDPGIGFGKTVEHNVTILKELGRLKELQMPILVGSSRKSFIGKILGIDNPKERLEGSLATAGIAVQNGASILRVHDVAATRRYLDIFVRICSAGL